MSAEYEDLEKAVNVVIEAMEEYLKETHDYNSLEVSMFKLNLGMRLMTKLNEMEDEDE